MNTCSDTPAPQHDCKGNPVKQKSAQQLEREQAINAKIDKALEGADASYKQLDDYANKSQVFRRKMHKGKFAPEGSLFLVLKVYDEKRGKAEIARHIKGNLGEEAENFLACVMRRHVFDKYKI